MQARRFPIVALADAARGGSVKGYLLTAPSLTEFKGSAKLASKLKQRGRKCLIK
jgi:hypothetical protein